MSPLTHPVAGGEAVDRLDAAEAVVDARHDGRPRSRRDAPASPADLIAGLWQEAVFPRLPDDAPPELQELVQDIDNPRRVYAIHKASRRHDFQLLVDRYVFQLRNGCASSQCATPSCFTCRKRLAGKAPIRRYNPTSARTLAVYLASQDSPERGLCPYLHRSREPPAAFNTLVFSARFSPPPPPPPQAPKPPNANAPAPGRGTPNGHSKPIHVTPKKPPSAARDQHQSSAAATNHRSRAPTNNDDAVSEPPPKLGIHERPVSKDYRSFAAAAFGTVAFKMLEWLTPQGVEYMSKTLQEVGRPAPFEDEAYDADSTAAAGSCLASQTADEETSAKASPEPAPKDAKQDAKQDREKPPSPVAQVDDANSSKGSPKNSRRSRGSFRTPSSPTSNRRGSLEPLSVPNGKDEPKPPPRSATLNGFHLDKRARTARIAPGVIARTVPEKQLKPAFFDNVPSLSAPAVEDVPEADLGGSSDQGDADGDSGFQSVASPVEGPPDSPVEVGVQETASEQGAPPVDCLLPQSLRRLDVELVDFVCDTFQEDNTSEKLVFGPPQASETYPTPQNKPRRLGRRKRPGQAVSKTQWKAFNEQTIFDVLSNPQSLVQSFTRDGKLYDSQTLWYCMLRMTRAAPSLVLHSLWLAARSLFAPPESLRDVRSRSRRLFDGNLGSLSNFEAGCVLSVCLHALVAAVPCVPDSKTLYDMSRVRSHGMVLAGGGIAARQPASTCLEYDDVFSNDLALRLARRLFCAITARGCFAEMADCEADRASRPEADLDVLRPLLGQLDLLSADPIRILEFTPAERLLHETRVPTLLLDWARAVLLREWDGRPEFSCDGPFSGALSLMSTLYEHRSALLLVDVQFRVDYLAERLDAMEMPVAWLAFTSTRQKRHLLDYPYLFCPEALVDYFRSLNFSRMSRTFEESSSLKTRMSAIVDPGSLVTNPHHKRVLQDMLKTASNKFLVLEIGRRGVVRDAFDQLWRRQERELLRPLKIHLGEEGGEEGFDSGGVQQEFFRAAMAECLDPDYGAFSIDVRTRAAWFVPGSVVEEWKFEMIGLLVSLAVYNGLTLPVTFPRALYRKLLGQPVDQLHQIADGWPELAHGLTALQEWDEKDGRIEDVFARTYEFSVAAFGEDVTRRMTRDEGEGGGAPWPQALRGVAASSSSRAAASEARGAREAREAREAKEANETDGTGEAKEAVEANETDDKDEANDIDDKDEANDTDDTDVTGEAPLVTNANRNEYVGDYIRYLTDVSVRPQYRAFERGFRACLDGKSLTLLTAPILQSMVEGVQEIDIAELRRYTRYVGWDATHRTVRDLWSVVRRFDDGMKRKLLEFVTASDRVPVGGMRNLQFVVQRNGEEGEGGHLPTAYTCYGTLLLPEYRDREVLRERLTMALDNSQGFGFA